MSNKHLGSQFDDFLAEEGILAETEAIAAKRVISYRIQQLMLQKHLTQTTMAEEMHTSRAALNRLLDPDNASVTLFTLCKAALVLGKRLHISLM